VIHGLHDEQDMYRMGGLRKWMPITSATFIVGWLAIAGVPPFSGFWSKDEILANAWDKSPLLWAIGLLTAILTAYYMSRQVFLVFYGDERWKHAVPATAHDATHDAVHDAAHAAAHDSAHGHGDPHESPATMRIPLIVLAVLSAVGGLLNLPFGGYKLEHWLEPVFGERLHHLSLASGGKLALAVIAIAGSLTGIAFAASVYLKQRKVQALDPVILQKAWYVDDFYAEVIGEGGRKFADLAAAVDAKGVDGAVIGTAVAVRSAGSRLRTVQTGFVRNYALAIGAGAVGILAFMVTRS
jgi:NADH-quinone oxidoreductase subunit L